MIAEAGLAALWLAAALALLQLTLATVGLSRRRDDLTAAVRPVAMAQGVLAAISFAVLIALFVRSDMSVALVVANGHADMPLPARIAAAWQSQQGAILMWAALVALAGAGMALFDRRLDAAMRTATLGVLALIASGLFVFSLLAANPFARLDPPARAGMGPLRDAGFAFDPVMLCLGYAGLTVAFALAVGALATGPVTPRLARAMRPWVLGAWIFLTIGIVAGSYRTYHDFGLGAWWRWEPAETAAVVAWLATTALLHAMTAIAAKAAGRSLRWRRNRLAARWVRLGPAICAAGAVALALLVLGARPGPLPWLGLVLAGGFAVASFAPLWSRNPRRIPLSVWGMVVAHFGIAVSLAGIAGTAAFTREISVAARIGDFAEVGPWRVRVTGVRPVAGPHWSAIEAQLRVRRGDGPVVRLYPQLRTFQSPPATAAEAATLTVPTGQLYATIAAREGDRWRLRLWWRPLVTWIWLGAAVAALGGAIALVGRARRERALALRDSWR